MCLVTVTLVVPSVHEACENAGDRKLSGPSRFRTIPAKKLSRGILESLFFSRGPVISFSGVTSIYSECPLGWISEEEVASFHLELRLIEHSVGCFRELGA